jgi:hypothetical protein
MSKDPIAGFSDQEGYRHFAWRCGHVHDRPAVPDSVEQPVLGNLRRFLIDLKHSDPELFAELKSSCVEEALELDDWREPTRARLWFLGHSVPSEAAQECLDTWRTRLEGLEDVAVLENAYQSFDAVPAATYRNLRVISYWYLSDEEDEA